MKFEIFEKIEISLDFILKIQEMSTTICTDICILSLFWSILFTPSTKLHIGC